MKFLNKEPQSFYLEDLETLITCDHHYLISKYFDACVEFYFWQATKRKIFLEQDLQSIFQDYTLYNGER